MKVIPLNGDQVKGSHGRDRVPANQQPVFIGPASLPKIHAAEDVHQAILSVFEKNNDGKGRPVSRHLDRNHTPYKEISRNGCRSAKTGLPRLGNRSVLPIRPNTT